jgi:hypothetical protein
MNEAEASNVLNLFTTQRFAAMGEDGFGSLNSIFPSPKSSKEIGTYHFFLNSDI